VSTSDFLAQEPDTQKRPREGTIDQYCRSYGSLTPLAPDSLAAQLAPVLAAGKHRISEELKIGTLFPDESTAALVMGLEFLNLITPPG
jgi:hypothetical protein